MFTIETVSAATGQVAYKRFVREKALKWHLARFRQNINFGGGKIRSWKITRVADGVVIAQWHSK